MNAERKGEQQAVRQVIAAVNGPGEISSWLYPFAAVLKRRAPRVRLCAALLPSVFGSGAEVGVIKSMAEVDAAACLDETARLIYRGKLPAGFMKDVPGCVLHFGGEPLLSKLLARRFHYRLLFYGEAVPSFRSRFAKIFLSTEESPASGEGGGKVLAVGNLMVDAARLRCQEPAGRKRGALTIGLLPGSRCYQVKHLLPFFLKTARIFQARSQLKRIRWLLAKADYVSLDTLKKVAVDAQGRILDGDSARLEQAGPFGRLVSDHGVTVEIRAPADVMASADVALTIPGTNTAELAVMGVPMLVILPSQRAELYPMPGIAGHLQRIPLVGKYLKIFLLWLFWRRVKLLAHPNRRAKKEIVPEIIGRVTPEQIAARLHGFVQGPLGPIRQELRAVMGKPGAAERLVEEVLKIL